MIDERGAPFEQITAIKAVAIKVSEELQESKDHDSHNLGIDQGAVAICVGIGVAQSPSSKLHSYHS
jgi:hypothetical protein